jgi:hypothetical protein
MVDTLYCGGHYAGVGDYWYIMVIYFIYGLFNNAVSSSDYIALNDRMINELERKGRKRLWPNLR